MDDEYTKKELKEIEKLRKSMEKAGVLNSEGEYYLGDGGYISVELCYDLGIY